MQTYLRDRTLAPTFIILLCRGVTLTKLGVAVPVEVWYCLRRCSYDEFSELSRNEGEKSNFGNPDRAISEKTSYHNGSGCCAQRRQYGQAGCVRNECC